MTSSELRTLLRAYANAEKAVVLAGFFKTGKGQYGEGDRFMGVMVPAQRAIAKRYFTSRRPEPLLPTLTTAEELLLGEYHEERLLALLILVEQYRRSGDADRDAIFRFYLEHLGRINNWDLVDLSAPGIVGQHLLTRDPGLLFELAESHDLWTRRVAVLATFPRIRQGVFSEILALAELLLIEKSESHDLMHKAVGWMLREVGKKDRAVLEAFLERTAPLLPRTALRYAIERFPELERQRYLAMRRSTANSATSPVSCKDVSRTRSSR